VGPDGFLAYLLVRIEHFVPQMLLLLATEQRFMTIPAFPNKKEKKLNFFGKK
jgi:hypothetical protein